MMMRRVLAVAAAAAFAVACADNDAVDDTIPGEDLAPAPAAPAATDAPIATAQFESTEQGSGISGTAELRRDGMDADAGMTLQVMLMGLPEGEHAWHIHRGACGSGGQIVVALSDAGTQEGVADALEADGSGHVEETVTLDRERVAMLTANEAYSLNVHQGPGDNPGAPIACATLNLPADFNAGAAPAAGPGY